MGSQLFGPLSKDSDIRVGYINSDAGLIEGLTVCEANEVASKTQEQFLYSSREIIN